MALLVLLNWDVVASVSSPIPQPLFLCGENCDVSLLCAYVSEGMGTRAPSTPTRAG